MEVPCVGRRTRCAATRCLVTALLAIAGCARKHAPIDAEPPPHQVPPPAPSAAPSEAPSHARALEALPVQPARLSDKALPLSIFAGNPRSAVSAGSDLQKRVVALGDRMVVLPEFAVLE